MPPSSTHQPAAIEHVRQHIARSLQQAIDTASNAPPEKTLTPALRVPLKTRLIQLLDRVPEHEKQQGLSLTSLQHYLAGRRQQFCHTGELGAALRSLGWTRRRNQTVEAIREGRSGHLWFPPVER